MTRGRIARPIECLCGKKFYRQYMRQIYASQHRQNPATKPFSYLCIMCYAKYRLHSGLYGIGDSNGGATGFGIGGSRFDRLRRRFKVDVYDR